MDFKPNVPIVPLEKCPDAHIVDQVKLLVDFFTMKTGSPPQFVVRCPGRVNLIGEHIDYCGYPVFPMAIEKHILIAVRSIPNSQAIYLFNEQEDLYKSFSSTWTNLHVSSPPEWKDYVLCGIKGVHDIINKNNNHLNTGLNIAISGTLAPSAGLSSSSAVVCGSAVATWYSLCPNEPMVKTTLANYCANFERMIGTAGGGMDQAIQFLAEKGSAKYVEFYPSLISTAINLPEGASFYISHSGVSCNKGATSYYNTRVLETRLAGALIAKSSNVPLDKFDGEVTLSKVQQQLALSLDQMVNKVKNCIRDSPYSIVEAMNELDFANLDQLFKSISKSNYKRLMSVTGETGEYKLRERALHVFEEAARVEKFKNTCQNESLSEEEKLVTLGKLMDQSHSSCRNLYECSCQQLDHLVDKSLESGALGSRLTGAGWGGCTISLVKSSQRTSFEDKMKVHFAGDNFTFNTKPSDGISIYLLNN